MIAQQLKVNTYLAPCQGVLLAIHASSPPSLPVPEVKTEEAMVSRPEWLTVHTSAYITRMPSKHLSSSLSTY
eukprot:scaffold29091_cov24-Tisochrysis_lutea.AAC.1